MKHTLGLSENYIALEEKHGAHNYHPLPVVLEKGLGAKGVGRGRQRIF
ncbi:MAG: hypothetical protein U0V04_06520 [Spirosomataceae bacterium]